MNKHKIKSKIESQNVFVGKDILELLSGGMYNNPLDIYREYIQNSFDAIRSETKSKLTDNPQVSINIEPITRTISIIDYGPGIANSDFIEVLTSIGNSGKRSNNYIGFRGVGRLGGLGYAKKIVMRSKGIKDTHAIEMVWDGIKLRHLLNDFEQKINLQTLLSEIITVNTVEVDHQTKSFFEVKLEGVMRSKNDVLLNENEIFEYLSQVAPVPFHPKFNYKQTIDNLLEEHNVSTGITIHLARLDKTIYRPFFDDFSVTGTTEDSYKEIEIFTIPGLSDGIDAVGWVLHHNYLGSLPKALSIRGVRARYKNMQVGGEDIFQMMFPESRFNSWTTAEVHILNPKIKPNARRDNFEHNIHYDNLLNHLTVIGSQIARKCRKSSSDRTIKRRAKYLIESLKDNGLLLHNNMVSGEHAKTTKKIVNSSIRELELLFDKIDDLDDEMLGYSTVLENHKSTHLAKESSISDAGMLLNNHGIKHEAYQEIIQAILEVMGDRPKALNLINQVLSRVL
mgnify:CR=1 FL=1|jgi:hypothetical protein